MPTAFKTLTNTDTIGGLPVSGAVLWFDASDTSTLFTDAGTTNVSSNGQSVYQWNDKSGNARHITQATSGNRPTYVSAANGKNGLSVVNFGGSQFFSANSFTSTNTATVFNVCVESGWVSAMTLMFLSPYSSGGHICGRLFPGSGAWYSGNADDFLTNGSTGTIYVNNTATTTNSYQSWKILNLVKTSAVSKSGVGIGHDPLYGRYWLGKMAEIIVYPTALSSTDRTSVYNYLKDKWATP